MSARGTVGLALLVFVVSLTDSILNSGTAGAQESRDHLLTGCGICYPGGYDINTVGDVEGIVTDIHLPAEGPVRLTVAFERERWVVLASPAWFWNSAALRLAPGDSVSVRGSKTMGADGTLYVIAREVRLGRSGTALILRDPGGVPLWKGRNGGNGNPGGEAGGGRGPALGRGGSCEANSTR
jgi:hypothetical protein